MDAAESVGPLMESVESTVTIEKALELTGYGKYTIFFTLACGLCLYGANCEIYAVGFILPAAECDLELDTNSKSLLAGAGITGMILSANIWGFLSDRYGRKNIIVYAGFGSVCCSFIALLSQSFWAFAIFKCLSGAFVTGTLSITYAYFGEFVPEKHRSKSIVFLGILQNVSLMYISALAWILLPLKHSFSIFGYEYNSWRIFLFLNIFPLLFGVLALSFFPESPKFLLSNGDSNGTIEVLKKIYVGNKGNHKTYPVKKLYAEANDNNNLDNRSFLVVLKNQISLLFNKKHLSNTICASYLQFGNFAVSSGLFIWYADILNIQNNEEKGLTICEGIQRGKTHSSDCDNTFNDAMFTQNLWIGFLYTLGQLIVLFALKYFRKTSLQGILTAIAGVCAIVMMFVTSAMFINILFVVFLVLPGLCIVVVSALVVDLFPTQLRSSAISFSLNMGRISCLITTSIVGYLIQFNCYATFSIYAGCMISCAVVAGLMRSKDTPTLKANL